MVKDFDPPGDRSEQRLRLPVAELASAPAADAASNDASSDDHVRDEKVAAGPTKWQKVKSHFWRYKWWYLLLIAVLLAILLPLL